MSEPEAVPMLFMCPCGEFVDCIVPMSEEERAEFDRVKAEWKRWVTLIRTKAGSPRRHLCRCALFPNYPPARE